MKFKKWTPSKIEEVIASLWFITGFQSIMAGYPKLSILFFLKAMSDVWCIYLTCREEEPEEEETEEDERKHKS